MANYDVKQVSELNVGEWAQVNGEWAQVLACSPETGGWVRLELKDWLLPETTMHGTVPVPCSPVKPEGPA